MQDDIASTVTHIQIQVQEGNSTAINDVMELLVRKHDQRSWRSSSTVRSAVRRSSLTSINSRAAPRKRAPNSDHTNQSFTSYIFFSSLLHFQSLNTCSLNTSTLNTRTALRFIGVASSRFK